MRPTSLEETKVLPVKTGKKEGSLEAYHRSKLMKFLCQDLVMKMPNVKMQGNLHAHSTCYVAEFSSMALSTSWLGRDLFRGP